MLQHTIEFHPSEETLRGIDGVLAWSADEQVGAGPGGALCIPRGAIHQFDSNAFASWVRTLRVAPAVSAAGADLRLAREPDRW